MTFVLEMPDDEMMAIEAIAQERGLSAQQYARQVLKNEVVQAADHKTDDRPISEVIAGIMADVPQEVLAQLSKDGASQHDHYIYGWPKRDV